MSNQRRTFIDACLSGDATVEQIDDAIERWHAGEGGSSLEKYLGMTFEEYATWVERPESLRYIIRARRYDLDLEDILRSIDLESVAARSEDGAEATAVLRWLQSIGRVAKP